MKAWHFAADNRKLGYGDNRLVETGRTYKAKGEISMCQNGMHGSIRIIDALKYAHGSIICRVDITGDVIVGDDNIVGRSRKVLWTLDATNILHEFACRCAEDALALVDKPDPRSIAAIQAKRDWLAGKISNDELAAARDAAWDADRAAAWATDKAAVDIAAKAAAWAAAREAARAAARAAAREAARAAAWEAARDAVGVPTSSDAAWDADRAAAWAAARDEAWDADRVATRAAAWEAAWEANRDEQNSRLAAMVCAIFWC